MQQIAAAEPVKTPYFQEINRHWRPLVAASTGMGAGFLLNHYVASTFAPRLIAEFGWSRSEFALVGTLGLVTMFVTPVIGRLTDLLGVRRIAMIGVIAFPLTFVAFSMMTGSIAMFAAITVAQFVLVGATTSSTVYSRLVAANFFSARGLALAIAATTPAAVGVIGSPLLHHFIDVNGWRAGYLAMAVYVAIVGAIALMLVPRRPTTSDAQNAAARQRRSTIADYREILRSPAFWAIAGGMFLCNLLYPLQSSQMELMLLESGASTSSAGWMISLFAGGVLVGRFCCGVALDRFPAHLVAAIAMGLPAIGLFALALGVHAPVTLAGSVMLLGLSLGAESDLAAYLVIRFFKIDVYSSVLALVSTAMGASAALSAIILSVTLHLTDSFSQYMFLVGVTSLIGSSLFLLLGRPSMKVAQDPVVEAA